MLQMQCLPQYNAESSVTNRLAKQLKKAKAVSNIFLTNQQSTINNVRSSAAPTALGARRRESLRRDDFCDSNERRNSRRISQNPSPVDIDRS